MTERLYYHDPFLYEFEGEVTEVVPARKSTDGMACFSIAPHSTLPVADRCMTRDGFLRWPAIVILPSCESQKSSRRKMAESSTTSKRTSRPGGERAFAA